MTRFLCASRAAERRGRRSSWRRDAQRGAARLPVILAAVVALALLAVLWATVLRTVIPSEDQASRPAASPPSSLSAPAPVVATAGQAPPPTVPPATQQVWLPQVTATWQARIPTYGYRVIAEYPHDRNAFTQGLVFHEGDLYEGTGLEGFSSVRRVELETGRVLEQVDLPAAYFGEGLTIWGDRIIQLTWQSHKGFVYDLDTLVRLGEYPYPGEGWGLTHDGERLIMSDGTAELRFWDPDSFDALDGGAPTELGRVTVRDDQGPVVRLNELEYVNGEVYANVWQTDRIARIDPQSGRVVGWIDLAGLLPIEDRQGRVDVLNGIAYDAAGERLFVTGKWWPTLFYIELVQTP